MKQTKRLNAIVTAIMAISHNRIDYPAGTTFEISKQDVVFLRMSGSVREPTADELKVYEERQTVAQVEATEPDATDHAGLDAKPSSDNEDAADVKPEAVVIAAPKPPTVEAHHITPPIDNVQTIGLPIEPDAPQSKVVKVVEADPEAVQAETIGSVNMPPAETVEVVEPETLQPETEAVANPYDGWLKKDLNAELDKRGVNHDATATNDTLEALLIEDDAVKATAAS